MTSDRPIYRLNYQWQTSIQFNWPMVGKYDVIFIGTIKSFLKTFRNTRNQVVRLFGLLLRNTNSKFVLIDVVWLSFIWCSQKNYFMIHYKAKLWDRLIHCYWQMVKCTLVFVLYDVIFIRHYELLQIMNLKLLPNQLFNNNSE